MNNSNLLKQGFYLIVILLFMASCSDDNAADPNIPGSDRDKFTGDWICQETITGGPVTSFTISIQKHGIDDTLYVYNFNNIGSPFYAIWLVSGNSVTIPNQTISQIDVGGAGFFSDDKINLNYTSDGDAITAICTE